MPSWWPTLLLFVFVTHLPFFAWRWWRTGERRYAATSLTFALLVATYAVRLFAPGLRVAGLSAFWGFRVTAWASAGVSIGLLLRHHVGRYRARSLEG